MVVCDMYGLFPQSGQFLIHTVEVLLNYLTLKTPFLTFCGRDMITHLIIKTERIFQQVF